MERSISNLIYTYKTNGANEESLLEIINKFKPLIKKYAKKFPQYEYEDMYQELVVALIEAVHKIELYENEGQCVKYLSTAIRRKFGELYRKRKQMENNQIEVLPLIEDVRDEENPYEKIELYVDLYQLQKSKNSIQSQIAFYILEKDMSDTTISKILGVSRQYVNRCKKSIFRELKKY